MRLLTCIASFALVGVLFASPIQEKKDDEPLQISLDFFNNEFIIYASKYDIFNLVVPLNSLNFDESDSSESESNEDDSDIILFFVEGEVQPDGSRVDKGLYVLKKGKATQILANGRDAAASGDDSRKVFFGASDGLYEYDEKTNSAVKYGPITDSIIGIAKEKTGDVLYILTENEEVYKVSENGEKKELLEDVEDAKEIVLDYSGNLYFYSDDKKPYVRTKDGVEPIEGLPDELSNVKLVKAPFILEDSVAFIANNKVYILYSNGTSEWAEIEFKPKIKLTGFAPEAALVQYYAYEKKIYEFNLLSLLLETLTEEFSNYLESKADSIKNLASKTKSQAAVTVSRPKAA